MAKTSPKTANPRTLPKVLREPSTIAGLLTIAGAVYTGGASVLLNPQAWTAIGAGIALIFTKEGE